MVGLAACDAGSTLDDTTPGAQSIRLDQTAFTLDEGGTTRLKVLLVDGGSTRELSASSVTWSVSDPTVLSVANGLVTALRAGTSKVSASTGKHTATADVQVVSLPGDLIVLQGDAQAGIVDRDLPTTLRVRLANRAGQVMPNVEIEFVAAEGAGTVVPSRVKTGADGIAEARWKLGTKAGQQVIEARVASRTNPAVSIRAQAEAGPLTYVDLTPTDVLTTPGRQTQFNAYPRDQFGNIVRDAIVSWSTTNTEVAHITSTGLATALAVGETDIQATARQTGAAAGLSATSNPLVTGWGRYRVTGFNGVPGWINDLKVSSVASNSVTLSFTEVGDGTGKAASFEIRYELDSQWTSFPAAKTVRAGTCASPIAGTMIGAKRSCTADGLTPGQRYRFQMVAFRGSLENSGLLSNAVTGTTSASAPGTITVTPGTGTIDALGATLQLSATARSSSGATISDPGISWISSNDAVATVSSSGLVTARGMGSAVISATGTCCTAGSATITVAQRVTSVSVTPSSATLNIGAAQQFAATPRDANGNAVSGVTITWSSGNAGVASVNTSGVATALSAGSASITASALGHSGSSTVTVTPQQPASPAAVEYVSGDNQSAAVGTTLSSPLTVRVRDASGNTLQGVAVTWSVTSGGGSVSQASTVTNAQGQAQVSRVLGTSPGGNGTRASVGSLTPVNFSATATVGQVASVQVTPGTTSVAAGANVQLAAAASDQYGNSISNPGLNWSSSSPTTANVNGSGLVTGMSAGTATVRASATSVEGTSSVNVTQQSTPTTDPGTVSTLSVSNATSSAVTLRFTEVSDGTGQPARYQIRYYPGVMGWNWGTATPVSQGTCANVVQGVTVGGVLTCTVLGLSPSTRYDFQVIAYRGDMSGTATFGGLSNVATGTTTSGSAQGTITISPAGGTLTSVGAILQLSATARDGTGATVSNPGITWTSANTTVATVDATGRVTARAIGTAVITAAAACCISDQVTVSVTQSIASIAITPSSATVSAGATTSLTATARDANSNTIGGVVFTWSSSNASAATVNSSGTVSGVAAGAATITASAGGQAATAGVTVTTGGGGGGQGTLSISPNGTVFVNTGSSSQLTVTARDAGGNVIANPGVSWTTSNATIATVNAQGLVSGHAVGTATITASASCCTSVTVQVSVSQAPPANSGFWSNEPAGYTVMTDRDWSGGWSQAGWSQSTIQNIVTGQPKPNGAPGVNAANAGQIEAVRDWTGAMRNTLQIYYPQGYPSGFGQFMDRFQMSSRPTRIFLGWVFKQSAGFPNCAGSFKGWYVGAPTHPWSDVLVQVSQRPTYLNVPNNAGDIKLSSNVNGAEQYPAAPSNAPYVGSSQYGTTRATIGTGVWVKLEMLMDSGAGSVRWWITPLEGPGAGTTYAFGPASVGFAGAFDHAYITSLWGGQCGNMPSDHYTWHARAYISAN